jgi:hypothetical protein
MCAGDAASWHFAHTEEWGKVFHGIAASAVRPALTAKHEKQSYEGSTDNFMFKYPPPKFRACVLGHVPLDQLLHNASKTQYSGRTRKRKYEGRQEKNNDNPTHICTSSPKKERYVCTFSPPPPPIFFTACVGVSQKVEFKNARTHFTFLEKSPCRKLFTKQN